MTWAVTVNGAPAGDGFYFDDSSSANDYKYERGNRVLYMGDELLRNRKVAGKRDSGTIPQNSVGLYLVYGNAHTTIQNQDFFNHFMIKNTIQKSFNDALKEWTDLIDAGSVYDRCWVEDASSTSTPSQVDYEVLALDGVGGSACDGWDGTW